MAAIRENRDRQAARGFFGLWRVAGSLVSAMVAIVLVLVALNIFTPAPSRVQTAAATRNWYSVERVMEDDSVQPLDDQVSYDQALGALVEQEESNGADW